MQKTALSASALAVLRFRAKKWPTKVNEQSVPAFQELVSAGIMVPDGDDFRFTEDGWAQRDELISAAEAHLRSLEPRLPDRINLSRAARTTLARYLAGDREVTDGNRPAYRELARVGIMVAVGTFAKGDDCVFRITHQGWERRHEFQRPLPRFSASAIARSLSRAFSRIARGVSAAR